MTSFDFVVPEVTLELLSMKRFLPFSQKAVTNLKLKKKHQIARSLLESTPEILDSRHLEFLSSNSEEISQTTTLQNSLHNLPKRKRSKMTHILRPTQNTKDQLLLSIRLLHPSPQQLVLNILRFKQPHIESIAVPFLKMGQNHRNSKMHKLVVFRYGTVN